MSKSGEKLGQLISKLPEFFDLLRSNGVAKGNTGRLKCSRIYQDCRAPTSVRINANLRSRGLPELFHLKSARRCASRSHGRLRPAICRCGFLQRGRARDQRRSDHLRERVRVRGSGLAGSQFAANQVSDRVALEADDCGGNFVIGGGGKAWSGG